jgi:hypothetical protein
MRRSEIMAQQSAVRAGENSLAARRNYDEAIREASAAGYAFCQKRPKALRAPVSCKRYRAVIAQGFPIIDTADAWIKGYERAHDKQMREDFPEFYKGR